MQKSESIAALAKALAEAQGEVENAGKNSVNPAFKSRYADLAEVINTVRPVFSKHGLSITQLPSYENGIASVETILMHSSGEWISGTCSAPMSKHDAQGLGSCLTYLRRYSISALAAIAQEDDDGNAASQPRPAAPAAPKSVVNMAKALAEIDACDKVEKLRDLHKRLAAECEKAGQVDVWNDLKARLAVRADELKGAA